MTSRTTTLLQRYKRFPEFPPRDDMQNWRYLYRTGLQMALQVHYASDPCVTVACEVPVGPRLSARDDVRVPDLSVMIGGDVELMEEQNGYEIESQGKAPDFVLEVASHSTGTFDYTDKRADYERYGVREYWRFDPSDGVYHDTPLAGDRLVGGRYEPIEIERIARDRLRGYSEELGLYLCWEFGELRFFDPVANRYLPTHEDEVARADAEAARADAERTARLEAEAELRRLRGE